MWNFIEVWIIIRYNADPNLRDNIDIGYCSALHRAVDEFVNGKEKEMVENSGLKLTTKGNKKYKVQKTEQDDHNLTVEDYKNTLASRTTIRADGNKEIRTPDGKEEYIVTQDNKVIKCK